MNYRPYLMGVALGLTKNAPYVEEKRDGYRFKKKRKKKNETAHNSRKRNRAKRARGTRR